MVALPSVHAANHQLTHTNPLKAVFTGATAGIDSYTLRALAIAHNTTGLGLRAFLIGRTESKARSLLAECQNLCPSGTFSFIQAPNLSLLSDVDTACHELQTLISASDLPAKIDILVMTQGFLDFSGIRAPTPEGLDASMSLLYYSRIHFITNLLPLLLASDSPTGAHVLSVYAAGMAKRLHASDLSLREPGHYSIGSCRSHCVWMKTAVFESLAEKHEGWLSLVHSFPGIVVTEAYGDGSQPLWFRALWRVVSPFQRWFAVPREESVERHLFLASGRFLARGGREARGVVARGTDGEVGGGAYAVGADGEDLEKGSVYQGMDEKAFREKAWAHTMAAFREIEAGREFGG